ncbi:MAG: altronate dehydratase family protein [Saprospiraceae bacterium]|nr:altronate dehydratase family protein [Saprospiraceae bacterium]
MKQQVIKVHPGDNLVVALRDFAEGETVELDGQEMELREGVPQKHKFNEADLQAGDPVLMYGVVVGKTTRFIPKGSRISRDNVVHKANPYRIGERHTDWSAPDTSRFQARTFMGYHRADAQVGTRNYWLVIPLVFCENRNVGLMKQLMLDELGYRQKTGYALNVRKLVREYRSGAALTAILETDILEPDAEDPDERLFPGVDGIKFLEHTGGCGGIRQDSEALCQLLAGYITHPNVAGATVLSLGCQNAQIPILEAAIAQRDPGFSKPLFVLEQQTSRSERQFIADAVKQTFVGLIQANACVRQPAGLDKLSLGLECGGSDGFSGISANPVLGYASDLLVALGGKAILSEFPELNGAEQELINRCVHTADAEKFVTLMETYAQRAVASGSGFDMNPSPGNIKDGLITDAMKSAGAAKKGGSSPVTAVLDYTEPALRSGLNLLCTPGNDVESTTGLAGSWANLIVFTTGLGTPTGNPVAPVVKVSSNTALATRMADIIDFDAGTVISGEATIAARGEALLELLIEVAEGKQVRAELLHQDDFIPWKRGISL